MQTLLEHMCDSLGCLVDDFVLYISNMCPLSVLYSEREYENINIVKVCVPLN